MVAITADESMDAELIAQLTTPGAPLAVSRAGRVTGPAGTGHAAAFERDPAAYALLAVGHAPHRGSPVPA
jgi:hypothetical protein